MIELNKQKILEILRKNKNQLIKFGVKRIGLFGSFVRDEAKKKSDIDFLVDFQSNMKNYDNFIKLVFFLEELFEREVDLLTPESMSPYIGPYILEEVKFETIKEP